MKKMIVKVYDKGTAYLVISAKYDESENFILDQEQNIIEIKNTETFGKIIEELTQNNTVLIPKGITDIKPGDLVINEEDDLKVAKNYSILKVKKIVSSRVSSEYYYDIFEFNLVSNKLYSENIFITNENREEKYVEIIQTNKPELIEALEKYLELLDKLSERYTIYEQSKVAIKLIENANSIPDVEKYFENFKSSFN